MAGLLGLGTNGLLALLVVVLAAIGFYIARSRALNSVAGDARGLHSLPSYYGYNAIMLTAVPSLRHDDVAARTTALYRESGGRRDPRPGDCRRIIAQSRDERCAPRG